MRARFASAAPGCALALVLALPASAYEREPIEPGDSVVGEILEPFTFDEFTMRVARGSTLRMTIGKSGAGGYRPALSLFGDDYQPIGLAALGTFTVQTAPFAASQQCRIIVGGQGSTAGGYRLATSVRPARKFSFAATADAPADTLAFGAYPGFEFSVTLRWKGPSPVTIRSLTGPGGAPVTSSETPAAGATTFVQAGFSASEVGDHTLVLDVPAGTLKWSASVALSGRLPSGQSHDFRSAGLPPQPSVLFPSIGNFPLVAVAGEVGGPNECLLSAQGGVPDAAFLDRGAGTGGCSRYAAQPGNPAPAYLLYCLDGFLATIESVERDALGRVTGYEAPSIRTPQGSGSASLSDFTYNAAGRPTGWTEVRRYDASGRVHRLVFSRAEYFDTIGGFCKAFRVVHTPPGAVSRTYDYAPFR